MMLMMKMMVMKIHDDFHEKNAQVGLPAKSGVSGSLVLVVPGVMGVTRMLSVSFLFRLLVLDIAFHFYSLEFSKHNSVYLSLAFEALKEILFNPLSFLKCIKALGAFFFKVEFL